MLMKKELIITMVIELCDNQQIIDLNNRYRNKNKTTDVLSFPVLDSLRVNAEVEMLPPMIELGDIFISVPVANQQAQQFSIDLASELIHLIVHGFLHLLGFDHEISASEQQIMERFEQDFIKKITSR
jgi:probable rRNA maturation factor